MSINQRALWLFLFVPIAIGQALVMRLELMPFAQTVTVAANFLELVGVLEEPSPPKTGLAGLLELPKAIGDALGREILSRFLAEVLNGTILTSLVLLAVTRANRQNHLATTPVGCAAG